MDGLLVETEELWYAAETRVMTELGADWGPEHQATLVGGPLEFAVSYMVEHAGGEHDHDDVMRHLLATWSRCCARSRCPGGPAPRICCVALEDAEMPRALVSASWRNLVDAVIDAVLHEVGHGAFGVTVAGDEVPVGKPDPGPYLTAAARLGVDPRRCIVVEDSPTGVAAGVAAGAFVVAVPHLVPIAGGPRCLVVDSLAGVTVDDLSAWSAQVG